jgi:hypothetical protein
MSTTENPPSANVLEQPELKRTEPEEYDVVILGGGTGSTLTA